jgi:alpha-tubulin suppressor-like RCC1 family protein
MRRKLILIRAALIMLLTLFHFSMANAQCTWFTQIAAGNTALHNLGIKNDGTLWAWGHNNKGQLGDGTTTDRSIPVQIGNATDWVSVVTGYEHSLAIKSDGTLWGWGNNLSSQLGVQTYPLINILTPFQIGTGNNWISVTAGNVHSLGIKSDGTLWAWGENLDGELGTGTDPNQNLLVTQVGTATDWVSVGAGQYFSAGLKNDGTIWGWGANMYFQLGDNNTAKKIFPTQIGTSTNWVALTVGYGHCAGVKSDGTLWNWGRGGSALSTPTQVDAATNWVSVVGGYASNVATKKDGTRWAWGNNLAGQLGDGTPITTTIPVQIGRANWAVTGGGYGSRISIKSDGSMYSWGINDYGQLGNGSTIHETTGPKLTIHSNLILPVVNSSSTQTQAYFTIYNTNCDLIASVVQIGGNTAITGNTTVKVWADATSPAGFVKRHYEITPVANATTATGRVTLYFTQQDFTDFNAAGTQTLPIDAADAVNNKKNIRIERRSGISSDGTGLPATYSGASTIIDPDDANIIWNSIDNRWEVTFDATGFGGFFAKSTGNALDKVGLTTSTLASPAYSLRLLSSTYTGYAIRVRRTSDNATQDIGFTTNGDLDTTALKTFVGAHDGYVTHWYDQSGFAIDAVQATAASQPYIVKAGIIERINERPAIYFGTANVATTPQIIYTAAASMVGVALGNGATASAFITKTGTASNTNRNYPGPFDFTNNAGQFMVGNANAPAFNAVQPGSATPRGDINKTVPESVYSFVIPATGTYYSYVNGMQTGSENVPAFADGGNALRIGNRNDFLSSGNLWTPEIILFNSALSTSGRNKVEASQTTYYLTSVPLPLTWLSVMGRLTNNNNARITWQVNEYQVQRYQVEKSKDGLIYNAIGHVTSTGDGTHTYSFTEAETLLSSSFYRIKQIDLDGRFSWSPVITLTSQGVNEVTVFPNPANDLVTVTAGNNLLNTAASLHDVNGKRLQSFYVNATSFTINLANYITGIYFLKTADGKVVKIIRK